ncbi:MAG TPA: hypothetical protein EYP98_09370 [Planctomycetes bacterium]|nr:hypothetical protein [Planctomycetota bacterium]
MTDPRYPIGQVKCKGKLTLVDSLRSQPERVFRRIGMHSENGAMTLDDIVTKYAWHGAHHVAHITTLRVQKGW